MNDISPLSPLLPNAQHLDNRTYLGGTTSLGFIPEQPFCKQAMQEVRGRTPHRRESGVLLWPERKSLLFCAASPPPPQ